MTGDTMMDIPYMIRSLEQGLRAGYSLRQAVSRVAEDVAGLDGLASDLQEGRGIVESFADWAHARPERDARLVVGAVRLQLEDEGNLADTFGLLDRILSRS
jgi:Flp pilus assembly protein TadB